jgi:hypothetical protein
MQARFDSKYQHRMTARPASPSIHFDVEYSFLSHSNGHDSRPVKLFRCSIRSVEDMSFKLLASSSTGTLYPWHSVRLRPVSSAWALLDSHFSFILTAALVQGIYSCISLNIYTITRLHTVHYLHSLTSSPCVSAPHPISQIPLATSRNPWRN